MATSTPNVVQPGLVKPPQNFMSGLQTQNLSPSTSGLTTPQGGLLSVTGGQPTIGAYGMTTTPTQNSFSTVIPQTGLIPTPSSTGSSNATNQNSNATQEFISPSGYSNGVAGGAPIPPTGYEYNASGQLVNNSGQTYVPPSSASTTSSVQPAITSPNGTNTVPVGSGTGNTSSANATGTVPVPSSQTGTSTEGTSNLNPNAPLTTAGLVPQLLQATENNQGVTSAQQYLLNLQNAQSQAMADTNERPGTLTSDVLGQQGVEQNLFASQQANAQSNFKNALTEQNQQQSGLESATTAVAPVTGVPYGTQTVQPGLLGVPGSTSGGTSATSGASGTNLVAPTDPFYPTMQQFAQDLATGQTSAVPSQYLNGPLAGQLQQMATAINPNFNMNTAQGQSQAQTSNASTAGTAETTANSQIYQQQLVSGSQTLQQGQAISLSGNQILQTMQSLGINPSDSNIANQSIKSLAQQFSSPAYATFTTNLSNLQSKVATLLANGDIPTTATSEAQNFINGTMNVSAMSAALTQVGLEVSQQAATQMATASSAYQNIQNAPGASSGSSSGGWASLGD